MRSWRVLLITVVVVLYEPLSARGIQGDECVDAVPITIPGAPSSGQTLITGDLQLYTTSSGGISCAFLGLYCADVWYKTQSLPAGTLVTASTFPGSGLGGFGFFTELVAYTECGGAELACNDDDPDSYTDPYLGESTVQFVVPSTGPVIIRLAAWRGDEGGAFGDECLARPFALGIATGCVSVCDDPHFLGLNGVRYNFQGEPNKNFALVSDATVQLNSRFISHVYDGQQRTNLGATCLRTCTENVTMLPNGELHVNGKRLYWHNETALRAHTYPNLKLTYLAKRIIELHVPNQWRFVVHMKGTYINVNNAIPIASGNRTVEATHPNVHGVLGHTLGAPVHPHHAKCNSFQQGGCAVSGELQDYEVEGDLCSTEWKHGQFNEGNC